MKCCPGTKIRRPMTPEDVRPKVVAKVSIPQVNYDANGRPTLGHKSINLLDKTNVGRPKKQ
jgi:hypothetical protein